MDERPERRSWPEPVDRGWSGREPDDEPAQVEPRLIQLGRADRLPAWLAIGFVLFVAVAVVKPWPTSAPPAAPAGPRPTSEAEPTPRPTDDPLAALRRNCEEPLGWRVYSIERWTDQALRIWRSVEPATAAAGPADPRIPVIPLGPAVGLVGYCSPWDGPERPPPDSRVLAWRLPPAGSVDVPVAIDPVSAGPWPANVLGALFGPPGTGAGAGAAGSGSLEPTLPTRSPSASRSAAGPLGAPSGAASSGAASSASSAAPATPDWPSGRFVLELEAAGWQRWWAFDIPPAQPGSPG